MNSKFIQYGVSSQISIKAEANGLTVSAARSTSQKQIIAKYHLTKSEAKHLKSAIVRKPIDAKNVQQLLSSANYCCCLCKNSTNGYIIHHIEEYNIGQDNSIENLVVLCPDHHDHAHKTGTSLTNTIDEQDLRDARYKWETEVKRANRVRAMSKFRMDVNNIQYCNFHRLEEICLSEFRVIPETTFSSSLQRKKVLNKHRQYNVGEFNRNKSQFRNYFDKINDGEGLHFIELIKLVGGRISFLDLSDDKIKSKLKSVKIGQYVMFTRNLRGKTIKDSRLDIDQLTKLRNKRKNVVIEVSTDSKYIFSSTANSRFADGILYVVYGTFMGSEKKIDPCDKLITIVRVAPVLIALPYIEQKDEYETDGDSVWYFDTQISSKDCTENT